MNPYDFVHIDWSKGPDRRKAMLHNCFVGLAGDFEGTVTALTPVFVPDKRGGLPKRFLCNGKSESVIPGSTLKGLFRSVAEAVGPGCWWLFDRQYERRTVNYSDNLPRDFDRCRDLNRLCPTCRIFGMLGAGPALLLGKVTLDDGVCADPAHHPAVFTPILDTPKPRHRAWYLEQDMLAGRKFYFHQDGIQTLRELRMTRRGEPMNDHIQPVGTGTQFSFAGSFRNLDAEIEWPLLLYAMILQEGVCHKVGYAKPAGFGSVKIRLTRLRLVDPSARYSGGAAISKDLVGDELQAYLEALMAPFSTGSSRTLQDLRRIWAWPPPPGVQYRYPGQAWFQTNPADPIAVSP